MFASSRKRSSLAVGFFLLKGALTSAPCLAIPTPPNKASQAFPIRISLGTHARPQISGYDLRLNQDARFIGNSAFNLRCREDKQDRSSYVEYGPGRRSPERLEILASKSFLRLNGKTYRNRLTIIPKGSLCLVVNTLDLESYLAGVVGKEMSPSWPIEALKAQAISSRSYAESQVRASREREFDLEASTQDQVYDGVEGESSRSFEAVEATRGMVLAYRDDPLKAYFHANCGGITEVPDLVWGGSGKAFRPVVCPYHRRTRDRALWRVRLTRIQIENALRKISGLLPNNFFRLASLEAGAPTSNLRLSDLSLSDTSGNNLLVNAVSFRNAVGNTKIKSTAFQIRKDAHGYTIEGQGNGHGVGLCQVGARAMAEEGKSYRQILQFYYPLTRIKTL